MKGMVAGMSYFETWSKKIEDNSNEEKYREYVQNYYDLEKEAYDRILSAYPENDSLLSGKAVEMAEKLGFFKSDMEIFVGFLDGIQSSLKEPVELEAVEDNTEIFLRIDYEKLYWNMLDAKAEWLSGLPAWESILTPEQKMEITKDFRTSKIVHKEKIGRNDPCICGSGKKYKNCCANKAE